MSLEKILKAKEDRAKLQKELNKRWNSALVCFSVNLPGKKEKTLYKLLHHEGEKACLDLKDQSYLNFFNSRLDERTLKEKLVVIEENHSLGRFFDFDVFSKDLQKLSRKNPRKCFLCSKDAFVCARSKAHSLDRLERFIQKKIIHFYAQKFSEAATEALIAEVDCTPKPGLVDKNNSGPHKDMDHALFLKSAKSLTPYFYECVRRGFLFKGKNLQTFFKSLRPLGITAEKKMFETTAGINTHKGAIFSLGLFCSAQAFLLSKGLIPNEKRLSKLIKEMCLATLKKELHCSKGNTAGEKLFKKYKVTGIRGEAMQGFPHVLFEALPYYKKNISHPQATLKTFLFLLLKTKDTNILHRGGFEGLNFAQKEAKKLLTQESFFLEEMEKLDQEFTKRNLSPGGTADLLALTLFLESSLCHGP